MKDKLKAIACLGLAVCVASGLWACSKEDVQTEPESSNTTINYVYNGIYDISNIPEETLSGEMPVTEIETDTNGETYIVVEQPVQTIQDGNESPSSKAVNQISDSLINLSDLICRKFKLCFKADTQHCKVIKYLRQ